MLTDIINAAYFQAVRAAFQDFYLSFSGVHVEVVVFKEHVIGFVYDFHASCIGLCPDGEFIAGNGNRKAGICEAIVLGRAEDDGSAGNAFFSPEAGIAYIIAVGVSIHTVCFFKPEAG